MACLHLIPEFLISVVTVTGFQRGLGMFSSSLLTANAVKLVRPTRRLHVQPRLLDFVTTHVHNLVSGCSRAAQRVSAAVGGRSGGICSSKARRAIAAGLSAAQREQVDGAPSSCGFHLGTAAASLIGCVSECGIFCPRDVSGSYGHEMHARDALLSCTAMRGHARA